MRWRMKQKIWIVSFIVSAVVMSSCSLLPGRGGSQPTAAAVVVEPTISVPNLTDTPIPTATPLPTLLPNTTPTIIPGNSTPTPDPNCDYDIAFVADVTVPDDTVIPPGVSFEKTWRALNNGNCRWLPGSEFVFTNGTQMGDGTRVLISPTDPGETRDVTVLLQAPMNPGTYTSYWHLQLADGSLLAPEFYTRIVVPIATATRRPRPTSSSGGSGGSGSEASTPEGSGSETSTPAPTATTTASSSWVGKYYANTTLDGEPVLQNEESSINFNWGSNSPGSGVPADNFSATWTRNINFDLGTYRFFATADDGVRVTINDTVVIDEWHDATPNIYATDVTMSSGVFTIRVDYYEGSGDANLNVWWSGSSESATWLGEYWSNADFIGMPALVRNDTAVNFDWGTGSPDSIIPVDGFAAQWTRSLSFAAGTYTFQATYDDGMRVFIDNDLVLNDWNNGGERVTTFDYTMTASTHLIVVQYYEFESDAVAKLTWEQNLTASDKWVAEFFANADLDGSPVLTKEVDEIDFDWGQDAPDEDLPADNFSIRFTRVIDFVDGKYKFYAEADDGVRVTVDGELVIDQWLQSADQPYKSDKMDLNGEHTIVVDYRDVAVSASVKFWYKLKN